MVSTRQMCGGGAGAGFEETISTSSSSLSSSSSSTRATVVRRTTQYHQHQQQQQLQQVASTMTTTANSASSTTVLNFQDLPPELIMKTLSYLDYKKISNVRLVSVKEFLNRTGEGRREVNNCGSASLFNQ